MVPGSVAKGGVPISSVSSGLYQAVLECRYQQVKFFLDSGVRLTRKRGNAENVLLAALQIEDDTKRRKMFNYLLKKGANYWDPDAQTGRDVLIWAAYMNRCPQVQKLLSFSPGGLDLCRCDGSGQSSLHYATSHGNVDMVRLLVSALVKFGLSVDIKDHDRLTPLIHAQRLGHEEIVRILEEEGNASPNQADDKLFQSVDEWKRTGAKKRLQKSQQMAKIYGTQNLKMLPELDPRGLYRTKTTMLSRKNTSKPISLQKKAYTLPAVYRKNSVEQLRSILKYKNEKTVLHSDEEFDADCDDEVRGVTMETKVRKSLPPANSIRDMMDILSEQICDSYRDPALEKIQQTLQEKKAKQKSKTSTLAVILAKVKAKSDEMEKRDKLRRELGRHGRILRKRHNESVVESLRKERKPKVRIQLPPIDLEE